MMDEKRTGNAMDYQTGVNRLIDYCGKDVPFKEIDYQLLDGFFHQWGLAIVDENNLTIAIIEDKKW